MYYFHSYEPGSRILHQVRTGAGFCPNLVKYSAMRRQPRSLGPPAAAPSFLPADGKSQPSSAHQRHLPGFARQISIPPLPPPPPTRYKNMPISLEIATPSNAQELHALQIESFKPLLQKYQDYDFSPGAEKLERTIQRLHDPDTHYHFISHQGRHIGALRISHSENLCRLKQIYILPEYQGHGYAQKAITIAESLYPDAEKWELDTILQEEKLCYLYEKMGYIKTGKVERIQTGMDLVYYEKWIMKNPFTPTQI